MMDQPLRIEFGTDGIRGIAGEYPLDPATVLNIGRAIGMWLRQRSNGSSRVFIGRDTRISGHLLSHTLVSGLLAEGVSVYSLGEISTPGVAYLTRQTQVDLGIVISASHNPCEQNGIKVFGPDGFKLDDADEEVIEHLIASMDSSPARTAFGRFADSDAPALYPAHLASCFEQGALDNLKIVLDCANGAGYATGPDAFRRAGASNLVEINTQPNGLNINVAAGSEYVRRDRTAILEAIRANGADLGIAFDGDADRVVFVTPEGMLVDGDHLLGILAVELKQQGKLSGDTVVATDMSNSGLEHFLKDHSIALSRTKVGDRYVMDRMRQDGFVLGGEQAGHIILLDGVHTAGDGIFAAMLVASIVARNKRNGGPTLHGMAACIPRYPQVIASAHLSGRIDLVQVAGLADLQHETLAAFDNAGRVNMRFSGTEPNLLRTMIEGGPNTLMAEVVDHALALSLLVAQATGTPDPRIDLVDCVTGAPIARQSVR
jgi:phosphoglucosamine mutase